MAHKKILLVDDSSTVLMLEKFILRDEPYTVVTASNGEDAVRKAVAEQPDLILMDMIMPRMSGLEACRLIRDDEASKHIPIVMVADVEAAWIDGCTDYLTKPINAVELLAKVRSILSEETAEVAVVPARKV